WMPRNLDRRVEILFPVEDEELKKKVRHVLEVQLADTVKAHILGSDGVYEKVDRRGKAQINSQEQFCKEAMEIGKSIGKEGQSRVFHPMK
ncbi:MAG: polyphosphate kinase, partial [Lachnospiraceae bacterium]|nr:polyphosphate kinase [Lachnospiraceae bacterium]